MRGSRRAVLAVVLVSGLVAGRRGLADADPASVVAIGELPGGGVRSQANALSGDGTVVVGESSSASGVEAFRWTRGGGIEGLGDLAGGSFVSAAYGVSYDGSVVVGSSQSASSTGNEAFRWTRTGGLVGLGDLPGGIFASVARAASSDGSVLAGTSSSAGSLFQAMRWTESGGMVELANFSPGSGISDAYAISASGAVVVGRGTASGRSTAARWTGTTPAALEEPPGSMASNAFGCSADGSVVVGSVLDADGLHAVRWTGAGVETLGDLPGGSETSVALACSADGSVVVGYGNDDTGQVAVTWKASEGVRSLPDLMRSLGVRTLLTWSWTSAVGVSADGHVVAGNGLNPAGDNEGWVAFLGTPVTPPGTFLPASLTVSVNDAKPAKSKFRLKGAADAVHAVGDPGAPFYVELGGFAVSAPTLKRSPRTGKWTYRGGGLSLTLTPVPGTSRVLVDASFTGDLRGNVPASGPVGAGVACGAFSGEATVTLVNGRYALGPRPGDLVLPSVHLLAADARVPDAKPDALTLVVCLGAAVVGDEAPDVEIAFGKWSASVASSQFTTRRGRFVHEAPAPGLTSVEVDPGAEGMVVRAKGVDLGEFAKGTNDVPVRIAVNGAVLDATFAMIRSKDALRY